MTAQQLKNSILNLAISGKLVPQDPHDEPASKLVEKIRKEKDKLIKDKKIKPSKFDSVIFKGEDNLHYEKIGRETRCIEDEIPFEIPNSWVWVRLGSIGVTQTGSTPSTQVQDFYGDYMPFIKPADITNSGIDYNNEKLSKKGTEVGRVAEKGSILMVCIGGSLGKCYFNDRIVSFNQQINSLTPFFSSYKFIFYYLLSSYFFEQLQDKATGTATPIVNKTSWESILIPIPPLQEQKRIVDKLEEILPLVEKYKENKGKLDELNSSFPSKLKKSILDYAIKGKLVKQNLEDESVEILLQKIREEKQRLVKDKKIKADKFPQSTIFIGEDNSSYEKIGKETRCIADEIPFEIPQSWSWVRLGEICDIINGFTPLRSNMDFWQNGDIPWFTIDDMRECGRQISSTRQFISQKAIGENSKRLLPPNSILLCCTASIGEYAITKIPLTTNQQFNGIVIKTKYKNFCNAKFLFWVMPTIKSTLLNLAGKTTFEFVSVQKVSQILIPLPPLPEQKRIVAKIEELLKFVDILQSSLK